MKDLALHILDIVQNSIRANSSLIRIEIIADLSEDYLDMIITDDGNGMKPDLLSRATDPFTTTRTTRKTGFGLPLLKFHAELTGGNVSLTSQEGLGTTVRARFGLTHPDRQPLGDLAGVFVLLISSNPAIEFELIYRMSGESFRCTVKELREALETERFDNPAMMKEIRNYINNNLVDIVVT